jgi:hypothetical protein
MRPGDDIHLRVEVIGNEYRAYLNGSTTPTTSFVTDRFSSGRVGLFDASSIQQFDNVVLDDLAPVPEASSIVIWGVAFVALIVLRVARTARINAPPH